MKKAKNLYRPAMLSLMAATDFLSDLDLKIPGKWEYILGNVSSVSMMAHCKLTDMEREMGEEYMEKEELLEKKMGRRKFYSEEEIETLKESEVLVNI